MTLAYKIGGLQSEVDYGYVGADEKCKYNRQVLVRDNKDTPSSGFVPATTYSKKHRC